MTKMVICEGIESWFMSTDGYCAAAVEIVEKPLNNRGLKIPTKCRTK